MRQKRLVLGSVSAAILMLSATGCNDSDDSPAPPAVPPTANVLTEASCAALAQGSYLNGPVDLVATWRTGVITGKTTLPDFCEVTGAMDKRKGEPDGMDYAIKFKLSLPAHWNRKFFFEGGGGSDGQDVLEEEVYGDAGTVTALAEGYAIAFTNGGHENKLLQAAGFGVGSFGLDNQARIDYGYNAIDKTATTAKDVIKAMYGLAPERSYFVGCSNGGRQGMMFTQRFPDYFDGVMAGDPVFERASVSLNEMWRMQQVSQVSTRDAVTGRNRYDGFSQSDRDLFAKAYLKACDADDGVVDGMVQNPATCGFNPVALQCTGAKDNSCLSMEQVAAIRNMVDGPINGDGLPVKVPGYDNYFETVVTGSPLDAGWMASAGQPARVMGNAPNFTNPPADLARTKEQIPNQHLDPPNPSFSVSDPVTDEVTLDWNVLPGQLRISAPWLASRPDISQFKAHGGKIIFYHGWADPGPSAQNTIDYYKQLVALNGGLEQTKQFTRLFLIPAMGHCSGGQSTDNFDKLTALVDWVEKGIAPDSIVASTGANAKTYAPAATGTTIASIPANRTRPLCAYPTSAVYKGTGDSEKAENWECKAPG